MLLPTVTTRSGTHFFTSAATSASGCPSQPKSPITAKRADTGLLEDELRNSDEELTADEALDSIDDNDEELTVDDELRSEDDSEEELIEDEELRTKDEELRTKDDSEEELTADRELRIEDDNREELRVDEENRDELMTDDEALSEELEVIAELELGDEIDGTLDPSSKVTEELLDEVIAEENAPGPGFWIALALCNATEDTLAGDEEFAIELFTIGTLDDRDERVVVEDKFNTALELALARFAELVLLLVGGEPPDPPQPSKMENARQ